MTDAEAVDTYKAQQRARQKIEEAIEYVEEGRWLQAAEALHRSCMITGVSCKMTQTRMARAMEQFTDAPMDRRAQSQVLCTLEAWTLGDNRYFLYDREAGVVAVEYTAEPNPFARLK